MGDAPSTHGGHSGASSEKKLLQNSNFLEILLIKSHQSSQVNQGMISLGIELIMEQIYRANFNLLAYLLNFTTPLYLGSGCFDWLDGKRTCRESHDQPSPWFRSKSEGAKGAFWTKKH